MSFASGWQALLSRGQRSKAREDEKGGRKSNDSSRPSSTRGGGQISRASNPISRDSNDVITRINRSYAIKYDSLRYTARPDIYIYKTQRNGELKRKRFARGIGEDRSANTLKRLTRFFSR